MPLEIVLISAILIVFFSMSSISIQSIVLDIWRNPSLVLRVTQVLLVSANESFRLEIESRDSSSTPSSPGYSLFLQIYKSLLSPLF